MVGSLQDTILAAVRRRGRGRVFTAKDFLDLGTRAGVDQALARLARRADLSRLGRGLYHYPRVNPRLGLPVPPDADEVAAALGRRTGSRVVPSGAVAANRLGLSTQVPARAVYLTDGRTRRIRVGDVEFDLRHAAPKELPPGRPTSALVFQALRHLGRGAVDDRVVRALRRSLTVEQRHALRRDALHTTDWIGDVARRVAGGPGGVASG
jgi:hypothetical protein